ncbi:tRNA pseudouridine(38-40) synthase TruA [Acetobacterium bakii]|uniref:tRNA pseudouridine synthase A n=1 Tax=Acetobacterium bakii TaxID=52689 RepID=A0A0L6U2T9_9FIRM|nr:tRNA pseudouridine(38-40) synthase TruA [Acetobacterium bakii]KNZ42829.1 pseudouridine synthase [Acetobacterium bakii]
MKNIQLIISYRGTHYCGWQIQPNGISIQELITRGITELTGEYVNLTASGRTDARVHALKQCANFLTSSTIPPNQFFQALNTKLPPDIRILSSKECARNFHSRYDAKGKSYLYKIYESNVASPFESDLAFHISKSLDWQAMKEAAEYFMGEHDFRAFMASGSSVKNTVRTIESISFEKKEDIWEITFKGSGFLYNMVRIMVGTLYEVGFHRIAPMEVSGIIQGLDRSKAGVTAPAHGLYLKEVFY